MIKDLDMESVSWITRGMPSVIVRILSREKQEYQTQTKGGDDRSVATVLIKT